MLFIKIKTKNNKRNASGNFSILIRIFIIIMSFKKETIKKYKLWCLDDQNRA